MNNQFKVPEVDFEALSWDNFLREYFEPEIPLLIRNVGTHFDKLGRITSEVNGTDFSACVFSGFWSELFFSEDVDEEMVLAVS